MESDFKLNPLAGAMLVTGLTSVIGQVLLIREIGAIFYGNELSMGIILAVWLLWVAAGSWLPGRFVDRQRWGPQSLALVLAVVGLFPILQLLLIRTARLWLNITPGAMVSLDNITIAIVIVLGPFCFSLGLLFRLGARLMAESGDSVGQAYVWEASGAALGGILFTAIFVRWVNPFSIALLLGTLNWGVAFWVWTWKKIEGKSPVKYAFVVGTLLWCVAALLQGNTWNLTTLRWQYPDMIFTGDSVYGRLTITGHETQRVFYENGLVMFDTQSLTAEETIHPPLLAHPAPRRLLLIGGGVSGGLREALKHPLQSVDYVELDPLTIDAAREFLPPEDAALLEDPRVNVIQSDGRGYLAARTQALTALFEQGSPPPSYDVIVIALPAPSTGQINRFYTKEFFELAQSALGTDGILALGLPSAENYLNRELRRRNGSVYDTLKSVFPYVLMLPGDRSTFLASASPIVDDAELWVDRLSDRHIATRHVTEPYLRFLLTTERYRELRETLEAEPSRINRDFVPICYYYDMVLWLSQFYGELSPIFYLPTTAHIWPLALLTVLMVGVLRWRRRWRIPGVVLLAGLAGMSAEVVLLLAFQALHGYVYSLVSLVVATFMVGTALGAAWVERQGLQGRLPLMGILACLALYMGLLPVILHVTAPAALLVVPLLALIGGGLVGTVFPLAVNLTTGDAGYRAGLIYGVDLIGGCLGALLAAVLWVPLLGLPLTCFLVGLWVALGAAVLL